MLQYISLCLALWIGLGTSLPDYAQKVPNGHKVPHPCFANSVWKGVGHQFHAGGGLRNIFGEDFAKNGHVWDQCLCEHDSDGDGMTNGEELGDPNCVWIEGDLPEIPNDLHHPGICEPIDSQVCMERNDFDVCAPVDFDCYGMDDEETEVQHLVFNQTSVPSDETTYYCMAVQFDDERDLHAFAMEPNLDNAELVHHIDMYECVDDSNWDEILEYFRYPRVCGAMAGCGGNMLAAWAVGINGICLSDNVGIRIGKHGAQVAIMRIHYHNPFHREGEMDSSGLSFYVTPEIRQHDAQVLNLGQMYLEIPPGQVEHREPVTCSHLCTDSFQEDINLVFGSMHMHFLGTGGWAELWSKDGTKIRDIMYQDFYDYNAPHLETFDPPILVKPGETIRHVCRFHSRDRTDVTWRGQAATDEMCHIYFVYYPAQNLTECFNDGPLQSCKLRRADSSTQHWEALGCDYDDFNTVYDSYMRASLESVCDTEGVECRPGCQEMLDWAFSNHTCLEEDKRDAIFKKKGEFAKMQSSCADYPPIVPPPTSGIPPEGDCEWTSAGSVVLGSIIAVLMGVASVFVYSKKIA